MWLNHPHSPILSPSVNDWHQIVEFQEISLGRRYMAIKGKTLRKWVYSDESCWLWYCLSVQDLNPLWIVCYKQNIQLMSLVNNFAYYEYINTSFHQWVSFCDVQSRLNFIKNKTKKSLFEPPFNLPTPSRCKARGRLSICHNWTFLLSLTVDTL